MGRVEQHKTRHNDPNLAVEWVAENAPLKAALETKKIIGGAAWLLIFILNLENKVQKLRAALSECERRHSKIALPLPSIKYSPL
jgi:hypothetical protein